MAILTRIHSAYPQASLPSGLATRVIKRALQLPRDLGEGMALMMGYPMWMVAPHDEFHDWADCPEITLSDPLTKDFLSGKGISSGSGESRFWGYQEDQGYHGKRTSPLAARLPAGRQVTRLDDRGSNSVTSFEHRSTIFAAEPSGF